MSAVHAAPGVAGLAPVAGQLAPIVDGGAVLGEDVGGVGDTAGFDQFQGDLPAVLLAVDRDDGFRGAPGQLLELFDRAADRSLGGQHLLALAAPGALTAVPRVVLIGVVILLLLGSLALGRLDRKSTRLNSSHVAISYAVFCLKKKKAQKARPNLPHTSTDVPDLACRTT